MGRRAITPRLADTSLTGHAGVTPCVNTADSKWLLVRLRQRGGREVLPCGCSSSSRKEGCMERRTFLGASALLLAACGDAAANSGDYVDVRTARLVSVAYSVVSTGTASWPRFTVVSTLTDVSLLMIVVSRVCLDVITVSLACPTRSVFPRPHPARLTTTKALASTNRMFSSGSPRPHSRASGGPPWVAHSQFLGPGSEAAVTLLTCEASQPRA
jgi:hypothetical protein